MIRLASLVALVAPAIQSLVILGDDYDPAWLNDRCTSIIVGADATGDGGPTTSHTNDCNACDFRLSKVEAKTVDPEGDRPVYRYRAEYPRFVGDAKGSTYAAAAALKDYYPWKENKGDFAPLGTIPWGTSRTNAYVDGAYAMMNEHQLAIGESTCGARITALPVSEGGLALLDARELSTIALERCATAKCAVELMGALAEEYGYYGADSTAGEAGEALTVVDTEHAWVFHILADDTGASAVWAARRVPPGDVAVVANQFWRVFDTAAPSLNLPGDTDAWGRDYPFSVTAESTFGADAVKALFRDHYEGTPYDMTRGIAAGPHGDPNRFDTSATFDVGYAHAGDAVTMDEASSGMFERAISIFRCSYSFVSQSRGVRGEAAGYPSVLWVAQYAPHAASYVPVYVDADAVPEPLASGSLHAVDAKAQYWAHAMVGNWAARFWDAAMPIVAKTIDDVANDIEAKRRAVEEAAKDADGRRGAGRGARGLRERDGGGRAGDLKSAWATYAPSETSIVAYGISFLLGAALAAFMVKQKEPKAEPVPATNGYGLVNA
ncbi:C69 peptidase-like protein [Aureococcus anophagefferens]|nr:C69 peptidase-like protein [Aureococcus anophagefferens]